MAKFYLINTVQFKGPTGVVRLHAGELIDDTKTNTANITGAGGVLASASDVNIAAAAAIALTKRLQGAEDWEMDDVMMAAGLKQLGLT